MTIFVDHAISRFIFAPAHMRAVLALGASKEHLYDIPGIPPPPPGPPPPKEEQQQQQQQLFPGSAPSLYPVQEEQPDATMSDANMSDANMSDAPQQAQEGDAAAPAAAAATKRIKRPRNSWIIYRSEKSKQLHQGSANMSAGLICEFSPSLLTTTSTPLRATHALFVLLHFNSWKKKMRVSELKMCLKLINGNPIASYRGRSHVGR